MTTRDTPEADADLDFGATLSIPPRKPAPPTTHNTPEVAPHRVVSDFSVTGERREFCICGCPFSRPAAHDTPEVALATAVRRAYVALHNDHMLDVLESTWSDDCSTCARFADVAVRAAMTTHDTPEADDDGEPIVGNCPYCDAPIGDGVPGCVHWPTTHDTPEAAPRTCLECGGPVDSEGISIIRWGGASPKPVPAAHDTLESPCCADKDGAWCRDTTGLDHCVDDPTDTPEDELERLRMAAIEVITEAYSTDFDPSTREWGELLEALEAAASRPAGPQTAHDTPEVAPLGATIVRREPLPRRVTPDVVTSLIEGGASKDLVDFARRHVEPSR